MKMIFMGPPGCGKGTQAKIFEEKFGYTQLSTGDILRAEIEKKSELGLQVKETIDAGGFVSDDMIMRLVFKALDENKNPNIILDGCPRTLNQAQLLMDHYKASPDDGISAVISFTVDHAAVIARVVNRYMCKDCGAIYSEKDEPMASKEKCDGCGSTHFYRRKDDTEEAMKTRLEIYDSETKPLIDFFKDLGLLHEVNGMEAKDMVTKHIEHILEGVKKRSCAVKVC